MAKRNRVVRSVETPAGDRCVDVFLRPDGSFGYAEYRRDVEDPRGWFAMAAEPVARFSNAEAALQAARAEVSWLSEVLAAEA